MSYEFHVDRLFQALKGVSRKNLQDQLDYAGNSGYQRSPTHSRQELHASTPNQLAIADVRQFDDQLNRKPVGYTGPNGGEDASAGV